MQFTKKDFYFSVITGLITGFSTWRIFEFLNIDIFGTYASSSWMMLLVPILWIIGVNLGYFLGRWLAFFNQFGKFAAVGFTNAAIYFSILNIFIYFSGFDKGLWYSVFVAISFIVATGHGYFWNKFWVFESSAHQSSRGELGSFFGVYLIAGLVNTGIASGVVNFVDPLFGLTTNQWANMSGIAGSAVALIVSFVGVKLTVFKK